MREVRPPNAPRSWAADVLRKRLMQRRIRLEHDVGITEGELDNVTDTHVVVIDDDGQEQSIPSSAILAFEYLEPPVDHSDELPG